MNRPTPYIVYNKIGTKAPTSSARTGYVAATLDLTITLSESRKLSGAKNGDDGSLGAINEFDGATMAIDIDKLKTIAPPEAMPFTIQRLGHVVLQVSDLERSLVFYARVLGSRSLNFIPRICNPADLRFFAVVRTIIPLRWLAAQRGGPNTQSYTMSLSRSGASTKYLPRASGCASRVPQSLLKGGAGRVAKLPWSFSTPMAIASKSTGDWTRSIPAAMSGLRANGKR